MERILAATLEGLEPGTDVATIGSLVSLFKNIVGAVVALAGVVLFVMLLIGGFTYLFSGGDQKKLEAAKGTISSAIIGLVVLISAYIIFSLIKMFTGVDVTTIGLFNNY
jgi:ABC-type cobalamin transport system permease subunit